MESFFFILRSQLHDVHLFFFFFLKKISRLYRERKNKHTKTTGKLGMTRNAAALRNPVVPGNRLPNRETDLGCQMPNQRPVGEKKCSSPDDRALHLGPDGGLSVWERCRCRCRCGCVCEIMSQQQLWDCSNFQASRYCISHFLSCVMDPAVVPVVVLHQA